MGQGSLEPGAPLPSAAIFDFDGVIVESADIKTWVYGRLFAKEKKDFKRIMAYHRRNAGVSRYEKFKFIYARILRRPLPRREAKFLAKEFSHLVVEKVVAAPFVKGALPLLKKWAKSLPL